MTNTPQTSNPNLWGPVLWKSMEYIVAKYPDHPNSQQQQAAIEYFQALRYLLPCQTCQEHFAKLLLDLPVTQYVQSRSQLSGWLIEIHNRVNDRLGKPRWHNPHQSFGHDTLCKCQSEAALAAANASAHQKCFSSRTLWVLGLCILVSLFMFFLYRRQLQTRSDIHGV